MSVEQSELVGRAKHLAEFSRVLAALREGRGNLLVLSGDAGVGKTRLAEEFAIRARRDDVEVGWVSCWSESAAPPFWPWVHVLSDLGVDASLLSGEAAPSSDSERARFELFDRVWHSLREVADAVPRVLVLDDAQWADEPSLRLLGFVASRLHTAPVAVVVTVRADALGDSAAGESLDDLARRGRRVIVGDLSRAELGLCLDDVTDLQLTTAVVDEVYRRTGGNPLFARELIRLLDQRDELATFDPDVPTPDGLRAVLSRRRARVSPATEDLLGVASAVGQEFRIDVIGEVLMLAPVEVLELLDDAERARLVRPSIVGRWCFTHPLVRETAYGDLGLARRVRLHQDIGIALEALRARGVVVTAAELAHHFVCAVAAGNAPKAIEHAEAAGREAMAMLAYEEAARRFAQVVAAMDLCPHDAARRTDILLALGDSQAAVGDRAAARSSYLGAVVLARCNAWPERLALGALGLGSGPGGFEIAPFDHEHVEVLEEALALLEDRSTLRARVAARLSVALSLRPLHQRRQELSEEAVEIARELGDEVVLGYALASLCDVIAGIAHVDRRLVAATEIVDLARGTRDPGLELLGRRLRTLALFESGAMAEADNEIQAYSSVSNALRQPISNWFPPLWRAMRAVMEGRFADAARLRNESAAIGASAHSENAEMLTESQRTFVLCDRLEAAEALQFYQDALERWPDYLMTVRPAIAYAAAAAGDHERAETALDQVDLSDYDPDVVGSEWFPAMVMLADAAWTARYKRLAPALLEALEPFPHRHALDGIGDHDFGVAARPLGLLAALLGRDEEASVFFAQAIAEHRRIGAVLLLARTLRDAGEALGELEHLREAAVLYRRLEVPERVAEVEALLGDASISATSEANVLRLEGDVWTVSFAGMTTRHRATKGMADLARILAAPGLEVHVLDLMVPDAAVPFGDAGERLDTTARDQYRRRLRELEDEVDDADRAGDAEQSSRLAIEREALTAELSAAFGLGGRARRTGDSAERARSAVTQRVRDAIRRIADSNPALGRHLEASISTGVFCAYRPERTTEWESTADLTT